METEHQICEQFESEFAAIAALDRRYYLNPSSTVSERAAYAARQAQLESIRSQLYKELDALRLRRQFRRCRSFIRQSPLERRRSRTLFPSAPAGD